MIENLKKWFAKKGGTTKHALLLGMAVALTVFNLVQLAYNDKGLGNRLTDETAVHFIDVGQGDATLVLSGGQAVLIDAGPTSSADSVVSYLKKQGVTDLVAVIATHPHEDHIGGMAAVLANFQVEQVIMPNAVSNTAAYDRMLDMIETREIPVEVPEPGTGIQLDSGAYFRFLSPSSKSEYSNLNNYSIVAKLELGREKILFMGDAEAEIEEELIQSGYLLGCSVLKVGHHGSATSSTPAFLKRLGAKTAIISCGADNSYGHPAPETLTNLEEAGFEVIRSTASEGHIVLEFDVTTTDESNLEEEDAA